MGAGFKVQIINATPYSLKRTYSHEYQMEWNPTANIAPNTFDQFYGEFRETIFKYSIDDAADATYELVGVHGFAMKIHAKKKGVHNLPSPNPPSESGYGILVDWVNVPSDMFVYPPADADGQSSVGWIHDGVVTIAIGKFPGGTQHRAYMYPTPFYRPDGTDGDWTALRPSVKFWAKTWMERYQHCIGGLKLTELTIPGTHDAGTFNADGISQPWVQTQYRSLHQQLEEGVRALDVRLKIDHKYKGDDRFQFCHGDYFTNLFFVEGVRQINDFLDQTSKEIVIMDFHRFEGAWTTADYQDLAKLIQRKFPNNRLIPNSHSQSTLNQILATPGRVVIGMGRWSNSPGTFDQWLQQNTTFWTNAVEQYWCGTSVTTWNHVKHYMEDELKKVTAPREHLWALMAQYNYSFQHLGKPTNIPKELARFFAGDHGLRSNIIDVDWWDRVNYSPFQGETNIPNYSTLINAVPLNILKGYRKANNLPLF
jgi:1-phosphatidylinositol phosphodiesterase